jgi:prepilin-type N-terminal cleavage/methylation domain-containing protein
MNKKTFSGFTLIELLMVISIITLISSMLFSYVGSANAKSRDSVRLSDMKQINTATTMYYEDKGEMPISIGVSNGIDTSKTLVGAGYLSAEPKGS